jgi:hypothetical protein
MYKILQRRVLIEILIHLQTKRVPDKVRAV